MIVAWHEVGGKAAMGIRPVQYGVVGCRTEGGSFQRVRGFGSRLKRNTSHCTLRDGFIESRVQVLCVRLRSCGPSGTFTLIASITK
jgi:hypothetical protein